MVIVHSWTSSPIFWENLAYCLLCLLDYACCILTTRSVNWENNRGTVICILQCLQTKTAWWVIICRNGKKRKSRKGTCWQPAASLPKSSHFVIVGVCVCPFLISGTFFRIKSLHRDWRSLFVFSFYSSFIRLWTRFDLILLTPSESESQQRDLTWKPVCSALCDFHDSYLPCGCSKKSNEKTGKAALQTRNIILLRRHNMKHD